ncbi:MAG: type VI secretion system baseplate subunit TssE [Holosporales bacterium]|jgi:type VI secretion system lysozyme-like protein|nr:type VI secretion system baseplate subunit TssE [Holosporales bacterium]
MMRTALWGRKLLLERFSVETPAEAYHTLDTLTHSIAQALSDLLNERTSPCWQDPEIETPYAYGLRDGLFSLPYDEDLFSETYANDLQCLITRYEPRLSNARVSFEEASTLKETCIVHVTGDIVLRKKFHPVSFPIIIEA